jgi:hypothetical protein
LAALLTLVIVLAANPLLMPSASAAACEGACEFYGVIVSDIQPRPSEQVSFTGVITNQFGVGAAGVQVSYQDDAPRYNNSLVSTVTDSNGAFHLHTTIPIGVLNPIHFTVTMYDAATSWAQTIGDSFPTPSNIPVSGDVPVLYESDQPLSKMQAIIRLQSYGLNGALNPAIIYVSDGYEQPILHGVQSLSQGTVSFLTGATDSLASSGFNLVVPVNWQSTNLGSTSFPIFPFIIAALLKYGYGITQVYLLGWSAGGTAAAWALIHDTYRLFNLGVIMDAELNGAENITQTDASVFSTLASANQVSVPHLLIWGANEGGVTGVQFAMQWARNAVPGAARLDTFAYSHAWIGTAVQQIVTEDLLDFFNTLPHTVGAISRVDAGNGMMQILTNSQVNTTNTEYDPQSKVFTIEVSGQSGTVGSLNAVISISSIDGEPYILVDNVAVNAPYSSDANNYYVYISYQHSTHMIVIGGQNTLPEFQYQNSSFLILVLLLPLLALATSKVRRPLSLHRTARVQASYP